jgi:hypothetical protein
MKHIVPILSLLTVISGFLSAPAHAGFFDEVLRDLLGGEAPEEQPEAIEDANDLYFAWYSNLKENEKEWVSQLLTEIAAGNNTELSDLIESNWYKTKTHQEQQRVNQLYFNLQTILTKVDDRDAFYSYAFCINSGSQSC